MIPIRSAPGPHGPLARDLILFPQDTSMKETIVSTAEENIGNLFLLVNVTTRRAEQVMEGAVPAFTSRNAGPIEVALEEISRGRIASSEEEPGVWAVTSEPEPEDESGK